MDPLTPTPLLEPFHQVGFVVDDVDAAMNALGPALGVEWLEPKTRAFGPWTVRIAFSRGGRFELVEGSAGAPWDTSAGSRIDHLAHYAADLEAAQQHLQTLGWATVIDGAEFGGRWSYHQLPGLAMRIEVVDLAGRERYMRMVGADPEEPVTPRRG